MSVDAFTLHPAQRAAIDHVRARALVDRPRAREVLAAALVDRPRAREVLVAALVDRHPLRAPVDHGGARGDLDPPVDLEGARADLDAPVDHEGARDHLDTLADRTAAGEVLGAALGIRDVDGLVAQVAAGARITVHFHPDRRLADGRTVAEGLLADCCYRTQFETGLSNGSRSAYPGGDRDRWEAALFGGAYQRDDVGPGDRPRYGGLELLGLADGACPRFGSCYLVLRRACLERATFSLGDSYLGPRWVGTLDALEPVLAARLAGFDATNTAAMGAALRGPRRPGRGLVGRALDDYVEVQLHGGLDLARDVEALVHDPSFLGTATGAMLEAIGDRFGLALATHPGFAVDPAAIPDALRGPEIRPLATRLRDELGAPRVDAALLGRGAEVIAAAPERWPELEGPEAALQAIKKLWHVLVAIGEPYAEPTSRR